MTLVGRVRNGPRPSALALIPVREPPPGWPDGPSDNHAVRREAYARCREFPDRCTAARLPRRRTAPQLRWPLAGRGRDRRRTRDWAGTKRSGSAGRLALIARLRCSERPARRLTTHRGDRASDASAIRPGLAMLPEISMLWATSVRCTAIAVLGAARDELPWLLDELPWLLDEWVAETRYRIRRLWPWRLRSWTGSLACRNCCGR